MPRKREGEAQIRVHVWVFESDWLELKSLYSDNIGPSKFVRLAVRQVLKKVKERTNAKSISAGTVSGQPTIDFDLEPDDTSSGNEAADASSRSPS